MPHMQEYMPAKMVNSSGNTSVPMAGVGYVNVRRTPPPPLSSIFPRPPLMPPPPTTMEKYYATTAIFKPIKGAANATATATATANSNSAVSGMSSGSTVTAGSNTMSSKASSNLSSEHNYDDNMGTMNSQSTAPMINPYKSRENTNNSMNSHGGGGSREDSGTGISNGGDSMQQFQRTRTYNFRSYPDNL